MKRNEFLYFITTREKDHLWSDGIRDACLNWKKCYSSLKTEEGRTYAWNLFGKDISERASRDFQDMVEKRAERAIRK